MLAENARFCAVFAGFPYGSIAQQPRQMNSALALQHRDFRVLLWQIEKIGGEFHGGKLEELCVYAGPSTGAAAATV